MKLFEPCHIGKTELKNRLVMAPVSNNLSRDGFVTEQMVRFHEEQAKGGVGLVIVGSSIVDTPIGNNHKCVSAIDEDKYIPMLRELTKRIKSHGAKACLQLSHAGRQAGRVGRSGYLEVTGGLIPVAPSPIAHPLTGYVVPKELIVEEIGDIIEKFGQAARRAVEAGFDFIGLHCGHMFLCHQFLSPLANTRQDKYGGDFERRLNFALEVIERMKRETGKDHPIIVRMNGQEPKGGNNLGEIRRIARRLERAEVSAINVSVGFAAAIKDPAFIPSIAPMRFPDGCAVHLAENIKKGVSIPVIAVNKIRDAQLAERILQEGKADLISMARTLIADPDFPKKSAGGRFDNIRPCISCTQCSQKISEGLPFSCTVNPTVAKEREITIRPAPTSKHIAIIGGGPAGMEAAIVAARRGHKVTIYEKDEQLGGGLLVAVKPPGKADIEKLTNYLRKQVNKLGVAVKLGKEVDSESIERLKPDAVIVATGGTPLIPEIHGIESRSVVTALEVLMGKVEVGKKVTIIGGGQVGLETAEYLGEMGKSITVVEILDEVGRGMPRIPKIALISKLERLKVDIVIRAEVDRITNRGVILNHMGKQEDMLVDTVVLATGLSPNQEIAKKLKDKVRELYSIGDSVQPRTILEAIREGFEIGLKI